jgi:hypothetical protein
MNSLVRVLFALTLVLAACAPSSNPGRDGGGGDDDDDDGDGGSNPFIDGSMSVFGTVSGTVWAPGNNPDQVGGGQEIPTMSTASPVRRTPRARSSPTTRAASP